MSLDYSDKRLNNYFDALFVIGKMGNSKDELMALQSFLSYADFEQIKSFDKLHKDMIEFISLDESEFIPSKQFALLEEYEKYADNLNIAPRYKVEMYENVLIGTDKFAPSNTRSLDILNKIANNLSNNDRFKLELLKKVSARYQYGSPSLYKELNKKIDLKLKGKDPKKVEQAQARFNEISQKLKEPHTTQERVALMEEQLSLIDKCAFKRMQKFQTKSMIYGDLANEYACLRDIGKHNDCLNESIRFKALVKNIKDHIK